MAGPRLIIEPPVFTPSPYGLLSVTQPATPTNTHWQNGVTYQANCIDAATTYEECIAVTGTGSPPAASTFVADTNLITRGATPFTTYARFDCSPVGLPDIISLATDALRTTGTYQVEKAFWTGLAGGQAVVWPHLAAAATVVDSQNITLQTVPVTGALSDVVTGLGFVEQKLADCYNGVGVIHIPAIAIPTFDAWNLLKVVRGQLQTLNGNLVAAGAGYPGTSPTGSAPAAGTSWIYATGAVFELHGGVHTTDQRDSLDRTKNTMRVIAEQTWVLGWDCCHVGALIDLGVPIV